jgi:hypothetical protein
MGKVCSKYGEKLNTCRDLKPEGKRKLARPRRNREDIIKIIVREIER